MLDAGRLIISARCNREESRGAFWRLDAPPEPDNARWVRNIVPAGRQEDRLRFIPRDGPVSASLRSPRIGPGCFDISPQH